MPNDVAIFYVKSRRFDQGRLVRLKQFESRGDIGVIGDRIIKDRITVLAVSYFISLALAWARAFVANANRTPSGVNAPRRLTSKASRRRHSDFLLGGANLSRALIGRRKSGEISS